MCRLIDSAPFPFRIVRACCGLGRPTIGSKDEEGKRVTEIHAAIEQACESLGFLREAKPFSPHLTLARIKAGERHIGIALAKRGVLDRPIALGSLSVESVALMKSELKPTGSVYTKLWWARLGGN
jgi:RNA 2',3'-cyclic 3'-phosphodiesterase